MWNRCHKKSDATRCLRKDSLYDRFNTRGFFSLQSFVDTAFYAFLFFVISKYVLILFSKNAFLYTSNSVQSFFKNLSQLSAPYVARLDIQSFRASIELALHRAQLARLWSPDEYMALCVNLGLCSCLGSYLLFGLVMGMSVFFVFVVTIIAAAFPMFRLYGLSQARSLRIGRDLPVFIDYLGLAMGAGMDYNGALRVVLTDAPASPVREELSLVARDMQLGLSREQALLSLDQRLKLPALSMLSQNLVQAMRMGTNLTDSLAALSEMFQKRRFQVAEEKAGKISVKMMIPMMVFLLPATMLVLFGPMVLEWVSSAV